MGVRLSLIYKQIKQLQKTFLKLLVDENFKEKFTVTVWNCSRYIRHCQCKIKPLEEYGRVEFINFAVHYCTTRWVISSIKKYIVFRTINYFGQRTRNYLVPLILKGLVAVAVA